MLLHRFVLLDPEGTENGRGGGGRVKEEEEKKELEIVEKQVVQTCFVLSPVVSRSNRIMTALCSCSSEGAEVNPLLFLFNTSFCRDAIGLKATAVVDLRIRGGAGATVLAGAGSGNNFMSPTMCSSYPCPCLLMLSSIDRASCCASGKR